MFMFSDWPIVFSWWLYLFVLGIICLPLSLILFSKFWDRGFFMAKIIAILLLSYLTWLFGSLKLVSFTGQNTALILVGLALVNFAILKQKHFPKIKKIFQEQEKTWVLEEILFGAALFFWSWVRGFNPDIHGLEKFMDYGFVNSILRSQYFPPQDMWLSGHSINYYYFGHLVSAVLTKLSGINPAITYNLMIASLFAFSFGAAFVLGGQLTFLNNKKRNYVIIGGILAALLLTLGGNLQHIWYFLQNKTFTGYWYPDATRFIVEKFGAGDNTIHEFPLYSFVVADLHGHLLDLPFVLLFLALVFQGFAEKTLLTLNYLLPLGFLLGIMSMTNFWDLPIYLLLLGSLLLWKNYCQYGKSLETLYQTTISLVLFGLLALIFSLPFHLNFESIAKGIALVDFHSPAWMLFYLWGAPLLFSLIFLIYIFKQKKPKADWLVLILLLVAWFLILVPEVFYVKDIYIHSYQRANTMFKLTYQSFIIFALSASYIFTRILSAFKMSDAESKASRLILLFFLGFGFVLVLIYPQFAIKSYYGLNDYQDLDGEKYLSRLYPDDYQAILWLKENVAGQPVVLEAVGESYTDYSRVSANTGLPTVVGWPVHEWLWTGSYDEPGKRRAEVQTIYETGDKSLLKKYQVEYLFLGSLEKKQYQVDEKKFADLGQIVFQEGETKIYKLY